MATLLDVLTELGASNMMLTDQVGILVDRPVEVVSHKDPKDPQRVTSIALRFSVRVLDGDSTATMPLVIWADKDEDKTPIQASIYARLTEDAEDDIGLDGREAANVLDAGHVVVFDLALAQGREPKVTRLVGGPMAPAYEGPKAKTTTENSYGFASRAA